MIVKGMLYIHATNILNVYGQSNAQLKDCHFFFYLGKTSETLTIDFSRFLCQILCEYIRTYRGNRREYMCIHVRKDLVHIFSPHMVNISTALCQQSILYVLFIVVSCTKCWVHLRKCTHFLCVGRCLDFSQRNSKLLCSMQLQFLCVQLKSAQN